MTKEVHITHQTIDIDMLVEVLSRLEDRIMNLEERLIASQEPNCSNDSDELMTRKEVAAYFKVNIATIRNWSLQGTLKKYAVGDRVYFKRSEIETTAICINE